MDRAKVRAYAKRPEASLPLMYPIIKIGTRVAKSPTNPANIFFVPKIICDFIQCHEKVPQYLQS